jgi:hypothetical protein
MAKTPHSGVHIVCNCSRNVGIGYHTAVHLYTIGFRAQLPHSRLFSPLCSVYSHAVRIQLF